MKERMNNMRLPPVFDDDEKDFCSVIQISLMQTKHNNAK